MMQYSVVMHEADEGGYWVEVPALPGCYSRGETVQEALSHVKEAIELYLETLQEEGFALPLDEEIVYKVAVGQ